MPFIFRLLFILFQVAGTHCAGCQTLFCSWCMMCATANTMGECACIGCPLCQCPCSMLLRTKTRHVLGIRGSLCCDMCATQFCQMCVTYQMYHELEEFTGASPHRDLCECPCDGDHQCSC